jgi:TM2 domain-containing membrane protein YozV
MQKGLMIALVAAGIIVIAAIIGVIALVPSQQDGGNNNNNNTLSPTNTGRNLTLNLNENLGIKGNT